MRHKFSSDTPLNLTKAINPEMEHVLQIAELFIEYKHHAAVIRDLPDGLRELSKARVSIELACLGDE